MPDANETRRTQSLTTAKNSLVRVQQFDAAKLPRTDDLGGLLNFKDAIEPASRLIALYNQLSVDVLESLSIQRLDRIRAQADSNFNQFEAISKFNPEQGKARRDALIQELYDAYDPAFETLAETISYSVRRSTDFEKLGREARSVNQSVKDEAEAIKQQLDASRKEADATLDAIKKVAAEQGVSQQAFHFKQEGDSHNTAAAKWLKATVVMTGLLGLYALSTLFLHKWQWIAPVNSFQTIQLTVSKALIFGTIFFMLVLCSKNYLAHRHNAVVNKHRQNALATYTAIVKAAHDPSNSDIVLNKAADCIFSPRPTGYSKDDGGDSGSTSFLTVGPNSVKPPMGGM
ncbi:MAG: hypothetical protein KF902_04115 [Phycisphaeraceae bacterium]|nr:hypothetical protein [Phycisphaeraceae bacterium]MCW5768762.1 hypothetical protein [Phycisphaeraceae bacterium]